MTNAPGGGNAPREVSGAACRGARLRRSGRNGYPAAVSETPIKILILTDGKIGDLVQCRGVASVLTEPDRVTEVVVEPGWLTALPLPFRNP